MNFRLIAISLAAAVAFAEAPGGPRMHMAAKTTAVQSYLNLTDAQIGSLQQLHHSEHAALKPIFDQMAPLRESLHTQMQRAAPMRRQWAS